jgi:predicted dehydrogenase
VEVPTHVSAIIEFEQGGSSQSLFSFDSPLTRMGFFEITGSEGTLAVPDPNEFNGDLRILSRGSEEWKTVPTTASAAGRGIGVLEMARAIRAGVPHRAQGDLAYHVLDTMVSIAESIETGEFVKVDSSAAPARPLPEDWDPTAATLT